MQTDNRVSHTNWYRYTARPARLLGQVIGHDIYVNHVRICRVVQCDGTFQVMNRTSSLVLNMTKVAAAVAASK